MSEKVLLDYGSGGQASHRFIGELFLKYLGNEELNKLNDAAMLELQSPLAMSTDSYTVDPIFFPGGNIGSLAVHGTVNDVAMLGARPRYITCGYIIEEGFLMSELELIVKSMGESCKEAGVFVVTGDTKVVPKGCVDKIFINTTGIGEIIANPMPAGNMAKDGDVVIISGTMGDHGVSILASRNDLQFETLVESDSASLNHIIVRLVENISDIHVLRDPTRGGLATTLNEIAISSQVSIVLEETQIPVKTSVKGVCSFLGLDPLYLANEGKFLCILAEKDAEKALEIIRADKLGKDACIIGRVKKTGDANANVSVSLQTALGGERLLGMLEGEQLPRIC